MINYKMKWCKHLTVDCRGEIAILRSKELGIDAIGRKIKVEKYRGEKK